jgi:HEAT repeat protein
MSDGTSRNARVAAVRALVERAPGHEAEVASSITPLLDADDLFVRSAAATALGHLGQVSATQALQARRKVEAESRVINLIDAALATLSR